MEQDFDIKHWTNPCPKYDCRKTACKCGLKYINIPASLGDDGAESDVAPKNGAYCNALVFYEANSHVYIYSQEGIPTLIDVDASDISTLEQEVRKAQRDIAEFREDIDRFAYFFNTVADMKASPELQSGDYAKTLGYYSKNDGGGAYYKITNVQPSGYYEMLSSMLYAELIVDKVINVRQTGAKGDGTTNDTTAITAAVYSGYTTYIPNGRYLVTSTIELREDANIIGENWRDTVLVGPATNPQDAIMTFTGSGKVNVRDLSLECNGTVNYGILSNVSISKFDLRNINIDAPVVAGIYTNRSTYLGTISRVMVSNTHGHGFYIVPMDRNLYSNTSINLSNCYCSECTNAYAIDGNYMNMENCACDGVYHIAYDLRGFVGTLVSCGSEAYYCDYMFYGNNFTNATVVNAETYATYEKADSVHIYTGYSSTWVFVGGKLGIRSPRMTRPDSLGKFLEQSDESHIKFIGTEVRSKFLTESTITSGLEINDYQGSLFNKGKLLYMGYSNKEFGEEISSERLPSSGIYVGLDYGPNISAYDNGTFHKTNGASAGDLFITKTPSKINGIGWVSNMDHSGSLSGGEFYKIPIVQNGDTSSTPKRALVVGEMYYDTTLGMPKWCTNVGRQQQEVLDFSTAPTSDGTITITFDGTDYPIAVTEGMTKSELYEALKNANIEGVLFEEWSATINCISKDYRGFGGSNMFTFDVGDTGAVIHNSIQIYGANPQWKSLTDFVSP